MDEIYIFEWTELRWLWGCLVIDYPHKSLDNCCSQALELDEQLWVNLQIDYEFP